MIFAKVIILFKETNFSSLPQENFYSQLYKLFHVKVAALFIFLTYTVCEDSYVGETGNLRKRMNNHKSPTRYPDTTDCLADPHFHKCLMKKYGYLKEPLFFCQPFDNLNGGRTETIHYESHFRKLFKPEINPL